MSTLRLTKFLLKNFTTTTTTTTTIAYSLAENFTLQTNVLSPFGCKIIQQIHHKLSNVFWVRTAARLMNSFAPLSNRSYQLKGEQPQLTTKYHASKGTHLYIKLDIATPVTSAWVHRTQAFRWRNCTIVGEFDGRVLSWWVWGVYGGKDMMLAENERMKVHPHNFYHGFASPRSTPRVGACVYTLRVFRVQAYLLFGTCWSCWFNADVK